MQNTILAVLFLSGLPFAAPCVVIDVGPYAESVTITCSQWGAGLTRFYRELSPNEWRAMTHVDTIPAPNADTAKKVK
jgi:hypothetical protein